MMRLQGAWIGGCTTTSQGFAALKFTKFRNLEILRTDNKTQKNVNSLKLK